MKTFVKIAMGAVLAFSLACQSVKAMNNRGRGRLTGKQQKALELKELTSKIAYKIHEKNKNKKYLKIEQAKEKKREEMPEEVSNFSNGSTSSFWAKFFAIFCIFNVVGARVQEKFAYDITNWNIITNQIMYDICHTRAHGFKQCCKVTDNTDINCCLFNKNDANKKMIVCGDFKLDGKDTKNTYFFNEKTQHIECNNDACRESLQDNYQRHHESLKLEKTLGERMYDLLRCYLPSFISSFVLREGNEYFSIFSTIRRERFPRLYELVEKIKTRFMHSKLNTSKIKIMLSGIAGYDSNSKYLFLEAAAFQDPFHVQYLPTNIAHEIGHSTQSHYRFTGRLKSYDTKKCYPLNLIPMNIERDADIKSVIATEDFSIVTQMLLYDQRDNGKKLENVLIDPSNQYCIYDPMSKNNVEHPSSWHPDYVNCRIPYILELGEKYKKLTEQLEQKINKMLK